MFCKTTYKNDYSIKSTSPTSKNSKSLIQMLFTQSNAYNSNNNFTKFNKVSL